MSRTTCGLFAAGLVAVSLPILTMSTISARAAPVSGAAQDSSIDTTADTPTDFSSRGGGRGGGGGRRSDARLKHDITYLGRLDDGVGLYRFVYNGGAKAYVGVMAEEVQSIMPDAVTRGRDGYFRVSYRKLGLKFQSYDEWVASGARVPGIARVLH